MESTFGLYNSQRLLLKLIDTGMSREAAYESGSAPCYAGVEEQRSFKQIVLESEAMCAAISAEKSKMLLIPHSTWEALMRFLNGSGWTRFSVVSGIVSGHVLPLILLYETKRNPSF